MARTLSSIALLHLHWNLWRSRDVYVSWGDVDEVAMDDDEQIDEPEVISYVPYRHLTRKGLTVLTNTCGRVAWRVPRVRGCAR